MTWTGLLCVVLLAGTASVHAIEGSQSALNAANPIRKVVTMLQMMQKKVVAEGEKETALYEKYVCWCKNGASSLGQSIADANTKIPALASSIKEAEASKAQLEADIKQHRADRDAAKAAMAEATAIREKEAAAYEKESTEASADLVAVDKAIAAISRGMAGGFLQTGTAQVLRRLMLAKPDMLDADRQDVLSFLSASQGSGYVPKSAEIVGILKQMEDEMQAGFAEAKAAELEAIRIYKEMMAAKKKEVAALQKSIEEKLQRVADLGVEVAQMKNDLGDTEEALMEDKAFLADLERNCEKKKAEWDERVKTRALELAALADTIKILNDDDALELFKKTLPSASASLVEVKVTAAEMRARALHTIRQARLSSPKDRARLDFIALAIQGKKMGFEKVIAMIDEMVSTLKTEQEEDDNKREYCASELDVSDDKKKELERAIADLETAIAQAEDGIATMKADIKALEDSINALDKQVAEATEQRKQENEDYTELMAQDSAAKDVMNFAKNRLNKFYNPKLYKAPPKRELSEEDRITVNMGGTLAPTAAPAGIAGTGITALSQVKPPPAPETYGEYKTKSEENSGVIAMMDLLIKDLDKEMTQATAEEKDAQADYEQMMKDSAEKRAEDSKALTDKGAAKANMEAELQGHRDTHASTENEMAATMQYIHSLHSECDWLVQYYDIRKEARASEIDALGKARAVLNGADYSLMQQTTKKHLRRHL
jgi:chromosome segregation ATPase